MDKFIGKRFIFIIVLIALLVMSCSSPDPKDITTQVSCTVVWGMEGAVTRCHDDELNVTCYVFAGYSKGGISCIPDSFLD